MVNEHDILRALSTIKDPDLQRDIVSLGFVKNIRIDNSTVSLTLELTTPACPVKDQMKQQAQEAILRLPGVKRVDIEMTAQVRGRQPQAQDLIPTVKHTIAVGSGKGGVGKTTVAVNLAVALAETGAAVGLIDADVTGPNVPLMIGAAGQPQLVEDKIVPLVSYGVKVISIGFFLPEGTPVIWRGPMVTGALRQFLGDVRWGELDYLVVDLPPGTGDASLSLAQLIPLSGAVIVTTPQDVSLQDATKAIAMFNKLGVPILGICENMSYFLCPHCGERTEIFSHGGGERAAQRLGIPFLGSIPLNVDVRIGSDTGRPIVKAKPDSAEAAAFRQIARAVAARISTLAMRKLPVVNL